MTSFPSNRSASRGHAPLRRGVVFACAAALVAAALALPAAARDVAPRGDLKPEEKVLIDIFEKSKRSVVYITTAERVQNFWTRNVYSIPRGTGSGIVWDEQGRIITNFHVVAGASEARIRLNDGREFPAQLVGASPAHDLVVLKINVPGEAPPALPLGESEGLRVGQHVLAIGNPFGLDWSLTTGIVSAIDRSLEGENGASIEHLIQTDAAINPGNSGGPLLDSAGRLIGMNTAIFSPSGASAGIGFAVPIDTINRVATSLIETGKYVRPTIGIGLDHDLNTLLCRRLKVEGVFVLKVQPNSPAASAGLRAAVMERRNVVPGDLIVAINGKAVPSVARFQARLDDFKPGETLKLSVQREGKQVDIDVVLAEGR